MAIKIKVGELEISVDTGDEVREVLRAIGHSPVSAGDEARGVGRPKRKSVATHSLMRESVDLEGDLPSPEDLKQARKFLKVIGANPTEPVRGAKIAEAFGLDHPKAVGPVSAKVRSTLRRLGFDPGVVYFSNKIDKARMWYVGQEFEKAMRAIADATGLP